MPDIFLCQAYLFTPQRQFEIRALKKITIETILKKHIPSRKKYFFALIKNFPQQIENTKEIIQNMSEII